ncbi:MAG: hypothetical protein ABSE69_15755, partial [Roseiarcus sp.]
MTINGSENPARPNSAFAIIDRERRRGVENSIGRANPTWLAKPCRILGVDANALFRIASYKPSVFGIQEKP